LCPHRFAQAIADRTNGKYEFMAEHAHSCCTLLALKEKFFVDGKWHTWIDFNKFNTLVRQVSTRHDTTQQKEGEERIVMCHRLTRLVAL
jgi:hypothetical protein